MDHSETFDIRYATCTEGGFEVLSRLVSEGVTISEIISLTPDQGREYSVSGYFDVSTFAAEHEIPVYYPSEYSMRTEEDIDHFRNQNVDVLIVNGWQRLIPKEILERIERGALGVHGSASGLPKGRGRSPMNWSLIEEMDRFLLSVIHLDADVDSGAILGTRKYDINDFDDIRTLYYKLALATNEILSDTLIPFLEGELTPKPQTGEPTYYPKRTPEDGAINWENSTKDIYNLVRAVARPYPGAFTLSDGNKILVWEAQPFCPDFYTDVSAGTIVRVFTTRDEFLVTTGDGTLLITDWEADGWYPENGIELVSQGKRKREDEFEHE